MRKILSIIIAAAMIVTGCLSGVTPVSAAVRAVTPSNVAAAAKDKKQESSYKEGEALVMLKNSSSLSKSKAAEELGSDYSVEEFWSFQEEQDMTAADTSKTITRQSASSKNSSVNIVLVKSSKYSTKELVRILNKRKDVVIAEPNYKVKAYDVNDTYFGYQWALKNTGQNGGTSGKSLNAASKWDKGQTGSEEQVVAIVDTGVDYTHEDLKDNIWENPYNPNKGLKGEHGFDFVNNDDDPMDDNGHGSHCAGIIGASGNNGTGISGVNQNVRIMALKFLDEDGSGYSSGAVNSYHYISKAMDLGVNVVAINNSWGGGESSEIFEKLINVVGKKGALSVCAAGNSSEDSDRYEEFPASIDSKYLISVAATNSKGELASFSNYGSSIDIAAPGADILSSVYYDCYNPSLYDEAKQESVSQDFADYEDGKTDAWGVLSKDNIISNIPDINDKCSIEFDKSEYFGKESSGTSLKISLKNIKKGQRAAFTVPYELSDDVKADTLPAISMMTRTSAALDNNYSGSALVILDMAADEEIPSNLDDLLDGDYDYSGVYFNGTENYWTHNSLTVAEEEAIYGQTINKERKVVLLFYAAASGDLSVNIDDFGISKACDGSEFGKYDFYNGTSMAAPAVTGAAALLASEMKGADASDLADTLLSYVDESSELQGKTASGGTLDFSKITNPAPRIAQVKVSVDKKQITIEGGCLGKGSSVKVITDDGKEHQAEVISSTDKKIVIKDSGWINTVADLEVTNSTGKKASKKGIYLINGKKTYTEVEDLEFPDETGIMATNGRKIYVAASGDDTIYTADTADGKDMDFDELATVLKPEKYFKKDKNSLSSYDFEFGDDLVYMDGRLYNIASYSEVGELEEYDDDDDWKAGKSSDDDWWFFDFDDDEDEEENSSAYSSQYKLMSFGASSGKTVSLGKLPSDMDRIGDYTLTAYNGKLYLIGGYDFANKKISKKVKIYDPATKKWTNGPSLPEGRAGGTAVQSGGSLVYSYGYSEDQKNLSEEDAKCPANLVLTGKTWKVSKASMEPYYTGNKVKRSGNTYYNYYGEVSVCAEGVLYTGVIAKKLGDTFTYSVSKDKFSGTKYSFIRKVTPYAMFRGIAAGGTLYGFDEDSAVYKASVNSGLVKVKASKTRHGRIVNANRGYLPGSKVKLTAKPDKGYVIKSFTVNGKSVKGKTGIIRITKNNTAKAVFVKGVSKIKLNKTKVNLRAGKTFRIKAKVYPESAYNKNVTYRSSNTKYATVSSKGLVKAKRAGKGKTVTITVKAKDGSGTAAKCKIKIKR